MKAGAEQDVRQALRTARATISSLSLAIQSPSLTADERTILTASQKSALQISEALVALLFKSAQAEART